MPEFAHYMPNGQPAPAILTREEVAEFLRLDVADPIQAIDYYRQRHGLKAKQIGRCVRFRLEDVVAFVENLPEK